MKMIWAGRVENTFYIERILNKREQLGDSMYENDLSRPTVCGRVPVSEFSGRVGF